jgi:hypothetical protein
MGARWAPRFVLAGWAFLLCPGALGSPLIEDTALPLGAPPFVLGRMYPAGPLPAGILAVRYTYENLSYPDRSPLRSDPLLGAITAADWRRDQLAVGYGIGLGLTARADWSRGRAERSAADGSPWHVAGGEDLELTLAATSPPLAGRIRGRISAGVALGSGSSARIPTDSTVTIQPFTSGESRGRIGAAVSAALSGPGKPVAVHVHAEATRVAGGDAGDGVAGSPFRPLLPLIAAGARDPDRVDLNLGISFTHRRGGLYAEVLWPVLLEDRALIANREAPRMISPGCMIRVRGVAIGGQVDLPWVDDDPATTYDPHAATPDWALRIRVGTDFGVFDRDRDHDGVPDSRDRCPNEAEDLDHYQDQDGCPDLDNDGDGIPDAMDLCPQTPEDPDGYEDQDGCPEAGPIVPPAPAPALNPEGAK